MNANQNAPTETVKRAEAPGVTKRSSSYFIDPTKITRREGWNPRFDFGEIEDLADSLAENGMLNPIRVKRIPADDDRAKKGFLFELIDGDRRLSAIQHLMSKSTLSRFPALVDGIPAHIVDKTQDDKTSFIQMFVANEGKDFLPLEEAAAYKRMHDPEDQGGFGMTIHEICRAVGRKQMHVVETLALAVADPELRAAVANGEVGKTQAKKIAATARGDSEAQRQLTRVAKEAKKGSKAAKQALDKGLDATRRAKAAKRGKTLKIRALDDTALSEQGAKVHQHLLKVLKNAGKTEWVNKDLGALDADAIRTWVEKDDKLALAATFGALEALKAAAGMKVDLNF